ncbi:MAG: prolyl oligopeptidase family serine peptidase [Thermoanaerobaculia bacterium]|nr:prolyl oligopeptidase family serine peptidase [Thermoanaerobaculia bacterium]
MMYRVWLVAMLSLTSPLTAWGADIAEAPPVPATRIDPVTEDLHGVRITDPYRWLEDQESLATRAWIGQQNAYTDAQLGALPARRSFRDRLGPLLATDTFSLPVVRAGRYFFARQRADQDLAVLYVRQGVDGADRALVDPHRLSPDHSMSVELIDVTRDGRILAYSVRKGGEDETEIRLLDTETGQDLPGGLPRGRYFGGLSFLPEGNGYYYTLHRETGPRVYRRLVDGSETQIFGHGLGPEKIVFQTLSDDGKYLVIFVLFGSAADQTEVWLQAIGVDAAPRALIQDIPARFLGVIGGHTLFLHTNWQAPKGRVLAVDLAQPERENWREVVPENPRAVMDGAPTAVGGSLLVSYLEDVKSKVVVFSADGQRQRELELEAIGSVSGGIGSWDSPEVFLSFTSFHVPPEIIRYDLRSGTHQVWARVEVPVDPASFEVSQAWFTSKDGTRVPMFLLHKKGLTRNGDNPTLLTGYGGFTSTLTPAFSAMALAWAESGGVWAVANLRGGGEFGEAWHQAGMREKKQNVFDDFYAAAEYLIRERYTRPARLGISGGSNGGLLVGAAITQRPELFGAAVCSYPLLDMLRYHLFLVARFWVPEYGSAEDASEFAVLRAYSPYHNVRPGTKFPAVLFVTGDGDTRVAPLHARKMAALLQAANGGNEPILLRYHLQAGHSGGEPIKVRIENAAETLAFLSWQLAG